MSAALGNNTSGLAFRVIIYFAKNFDEELTSSDIATKWPDLHGGDVSLRLRYYRRANMLECRESAKRLKNGAKELTWSAGPALLEMLK
jgi:hypothetical protein